MRLSSVLKQDFENIYTASSEWEKLNGRTLLITGANGFIASYLINFLLYIKCYKNIEIDITAVARTKAKVLESLCIKDCSEQIIIIEQDVCSPLNYSGDVDYILHMASNACPVKFKSDPVGTSLPNIIGTYHLLEFARLKNAEEFIFFSTTGVYGHNSAESYPLNESSFGSLDPTLVGSCYLESKRMGENLCINYFTQYKLPIKIVRPAITFGPGIDLEGGRSYEMFISNIVNNKNIELYSDGSAIRNFCYISDFISGLFIVLFKGTHGEAYNLATSEELSIKDLVNSLVSSAFKERRLQVITKCADESQAARTEFSKTTVDISKVEKLGWRVKTPSLEGFCRTVFHYEEGV